MVWAKFAGRARFYAPLRENCPRYRRRAHAFARIGGTGPTRAGSTTGGEMSPTTRWSRYPRTACQWRRGSYRCREATGGGLDLAEPRRGPGSATALPTREQAIEVAATLSGKTAVATAPQSPIRKARVMHCQYKHPGSTQSVMDPCLRGAAKEGPATSSLQDHCG